MTSDRAALSVAEVATTLGVSEWLVYEAVRQNAIGHVKLGRRILISPAAVDRLLLSTREQGHDAE